MHIVNIRVCRAKISRTGIEAFGIKISLKYLGLLPRTTACIMMNGFDLVWSDDSLAVRHRPVDQEIAGFKPNHDKFISVVRLLSLFTQHIR